MLLEVDLALPILLLLLVTNDIYLSLQFYCILLIPFCYFPLSLDTTNQIEEGVAYSWGSWKQGQLGYLPAENNNNDKNGKKVPPPEVTCYKPKVIESLKVIRTTIYLYIDLSISIPSFIVSICIYVSIRII